MLKNIIIVNDFDYVQGGASKVAIDTANLLSDDYNVIFFSGDSSEKSTLNKKITKVSTNQGEALNNKNKLKGILNGIYNYKAGKELKKILLNLDKNETIIHIHGWTKCLSSSVFNESWKLGFKVVLTMHDYFTACPNGGYFNYKKNEECTLNPLSYKCMKCNCDSRNFFFKIYRIIRQFVQNKLVKLNYKLTDVISISAFSERILKNTLSKDTKIHRIYNPIELEATKNIIDYYNNKYYLFVGRLSKEKGVDIFCEAISQLNLKGIVVGDGPELIMLKNKYPKIEFAGWKNSIEIKEYLKKSIALIFPSRLYETMGLSVVEASAMGIPVIVSDNTSATEFAKSNIFKNGDINSLKEVILKNNLKAEEINKGFVDKFSLNTYKKNIEKLYIDVLE